MVLLLWCPALTDLPALEEVCFGRTAVAGKLLQDFKLFIGCRDTHVLNVLQLTDEYCLPKNLLKSKYTFKIGYRKISACRQTCNFVVNRFILL